MGLDNGIILKVNKDIKVAFAPKRGSYIKDENSKFNTYEICYWRKCWGIREAILNVLDPTGTKVKEQECIYDIEAEDISAIIKALKPFFSKEYWEENANSIWEWNEQFECLITFIIRLEKLKEFLENNKYIECYFYDSY